MQHTQQIRQMRTRMFQVGGSEVVNVRIARRPISENKVTRPPPPPPPPRNGDREGNPATFKNNEKITIAPRKQSKIDKFRQQQQQPIRHTLTSRGLQQLCT